MHSVRMNAYMRDMLRYGLLQNYQRPEANSGSKSLNSVGLNGYMPIMLRYGLL